MVFNQKWSPLTEMKIGDPITAFAAKDHYVAVGCASGRVSLWDLRALGRCEEVVLIDARKNKDDPKNASIYKMEYEPVRAFDDSNELYEDEEDSDRNNESGDVIGDDNEHDERNALLFRSTSSSGKITGINNNNSNENNNNSDQPTAEKSNDINNNNNNNSSSNSSNSNNGKPKLARDLCFGNEEAIQAIDICNNGVYAVVGDLCVSKWDLSGHSTEHFGFERRHNATICALSFSVMNWPRVHVVTQGQPKKSFYCDLESKKQGDVENMGCPWHTVPVDLDARMRLLLKEDCKGKGNIFFSGRMGEMQRLKVFDVRSVGAPMLLQTITLKGTGGYRIWNDKITAFHRERNTVGVYSMSTGQLMSEWYGHTRPLYSVDFYDDKAATVAMDNTVRIWQNARCLQVVPVSAEVLQGPYAPDMTTLRVESNSRRLFVSNGATVFTTEI